MRAKHLYIETYGCQMNVNDSERIAVMLAESGYVSVDKPEEADLILVNTCSVRGGAEEKVYRRLENLRVFKRSKKHLLIGVGGCVAQQEGEALQQRFHWLDIVFGTHNLHLLKDIVHDAENGVHRCETAFLDNEKRLDLFPVLSGESRHSSFVTVMQGCDNFCSYCIVPYVRGREISRRSAEVIAEVRQLASAGIQEVILLGQNVNSYGLKSPGEPSFAGLLKQVAEIDGIRRICFITSHPKDMSDELVSCFANMPKLAGQIHLPAQSGSNSVLARMNRGYTREEYLRKINALKAARHGIAITGDMIVGFPGETDEDFEQSLQLMQAVRYIDLFSFAYSVRPGTRAAEIGDDVPHEVKKARLEKLQILQKQITRDVCNEFLGTIQSVLVEGEGKHPGQVCGKADNGRTVNFDGDSAMIGRFAQVKIIRVNRNSFLGEVV
ncbi:MAG TPA: tRNA (N6-isopentenyl adenosine(37)-C2)-methylthiotransferase MiaB [Deltaproteobacteria bacterium]|nr:tRNA (N6-isopentenyl adenosine(37)-C2)-methylthiotransferase MiaB [Deltaproteobacteria bacterium]HQB37840.1 tRNA (N6-isopentenyl adenosine(37)-C2)-methylthiotransferase MiaB [Deltaproteobacteria bacterium]